MSTSKDTGKDPGKDAGKQPGALSPRRLMQWAASPAVLDFIGRDRADAVASFVNNHVMLKLRQRRAHAQSQALDEPAKAYLKTHFCRRPFNTMETTHTGLIFSCCPVYLPTPIGRLDESHRDAWHSDIAYKIRESIIDGTYSYCDHVHCPFIAGRQLEPRDSDEAREFIAHHRKGREVAPPPLQVVLSHDKSCNLACPSCRSGIYVANKARQARLDDLTEKSLLPMLRDASEVIITGSGDAFGSNHFRNLIKRLTASEDYKGLQLHLHTNGQLFDERAWRDLNLSGHVGVVQISIDAAEAATYANVRRPGNFERLLKNLAFLKTKRDAGEIQHLIFSMVVQEANYREMPDFVKMGEKFSADSVMFNMYRQRDIFSRGEFEEAFIGDAHHTDYADFLSKLRAPEMSLPIVNLGNLAAYAPDGWLDDNKTPSGQTAVGHAAE
ncbi:MAG: radical SAM protein [Rhodoblastus sp.]